MNIPEYKQFNGMTFQGIQKGTKTDMEKLAQKRKNAGYYTRISKYGTQYVLYIKSTDKVKYPLPKDINRV